MAADTLRWADVAAAGGIREWVDAEIARQGLADPGASQSMSDAEKKVYKARRDEERKVRKDLYRRAWLAYKQAHIVHLGPGVFWHDTADVDRYDADDPDKKRADNALFVEIEQSQRAFAERVVRWDMDTNVQRRMAYNHYFGKKQGEKKA